LPPKVEDVTVPYHGTHPLPFAELYQDWD